MTKSTNTTRNIPAVVLKEGAGVTVHRTIGTPALRHYDPFMMLDHFSSDNPDDYIAGFPSHPHRGFSTFTYMIDGFMEHKDSMGNSGNLGPGSAQLMKAASGIIHSEMPKQESGLMRGFQLWINLPAAHKMDDPEYQEYPARAFPTVETQAYRLKVVIGAFADKTAPIADDITQVSYFDVKVFGNQHFQYEPVSAHNSFIYCFEGNGQLNGKEVTQHSLITLGQIDQTFNFIADKNGARFIVISGLPISEPIAQYGPFVMNTRDEINEAMRDFQSNSFVRKRAWIKGQQKLGS